MNNKKLHLSLLALVLIFGGLRAQNSLQSSLLRDHVWSQSTQPANLVEGDYDKVRYAGQAGFWLGNTHAPLEGIFAEGGYITEAVKDRLIGDLKSKEDVSAGYHLGWMNLNLKIGEQRVGISLDDYTSAYARFNNPHTLGLLLKGNGPYAGDTVSDQDISFKLLQTRELGFSTAWKWDKLSFGTRLRLKQGIRMVDLEHFNYGLYTETNGTEVNLNADYNLYTSPKLSSPGLFAFQGFGVSVDLGMRYEINEKLDFDIAINDLGFTSWKTDHMEDVVDVNWQGINVASLLQDSISQLANEQIDSLKSLVLPDTTSDNRFLASPAAIRGNVCYHLSEKGTLTGSVVWYPFAMAQRTRLPLIGLSYQHEVINGLTLGANAYGLGLDSYGFGLMANYELSLGASRLDFLVGSDNLLGFVAPTIGRGMNAYAGIGFSF